jgi:hypothetical protein
MDDDDCRIRLSGTIHELWYQGLVNICMDNGVEIEGCTIVRVPR